jgi:ethanolaminephosphotransferase
MLVPLVGGTLLTNLPRLGYPGMSGSQELLYLRLYFVFALVVYFRWAVLVVNSICSYLDINALTITPRLFPAHLKAAYGYSNGGANPAKKRN